MTNKKVVGVNIDLYCIYSGGFYDSVDGRQLISVINELCMKNNIAFNMHDCMSSSFLLHSNEKFRIKYLFR